MCIRQKNKRPKTNLTSQSDNISKRLTSAKKIVSVQKKKRKKKKIKQKIKKKKRKRKRILVEVLDVARVSKYLKLKQSLVFTILCFNLGSVHVIEILLRLFMRSFSVLIHSGLLAFNE